MSDTFPSDPAARRAVPTRDLLLDPRGRALEEAADLAMQAPSVHNTQPWRIELHPNHVVLRADRERQLTTLDPLGRELVQSVGAALFNVRVALAAHGWAAEVERVPVAADPDLLAMVRPVEGPPEAGLAELAPAVTRRRTNRRRFSATQVPDAVLRDLSALVQAEGASLVPLHTDAHRRLVARLTQQADRLQNAEPAYRAEIRRWTTRTAGQGDGVPSGAVPRVDGLEPDELPVRDFDTQAAGGLPADTRSGIDQTLVLIATPADDPAAWLQAGEALQHLLLELTRRGWVVSPVTQAIEVPLTRTQLRSALTWNAHPQMLLRIGHAQPTPRTPRRRRDEVVRGSQRPPEPMPSAPAPAATDRPLPEPERPRRRPVSDGRGGTAWT